MIAKNLMSVNITTNIRLYNRASQTIFYNCRSNRYAINRYLILLLSLILFSSEVDQICTHINDRSLTPQFWKLFPSMFYHLKCLLIVKCLMSKGLGLSSTKREKSKLILIIVLKLILVKTSNIVQPNT